MNKEVKKFGKRFQQEFGQVANFMVTDKVALSLTAVNVVLFIALQKRSLAGGVVTGLMTGVGSTLIGATVVSLAMSTYR